MSLLNTRLQNFRADAPTDKWEVRASNYGAFDMFKTQTESATGIVTDDLATKAIQSVGSGLEIPVLDGKTFTIQNVTQPLIVADDLNTSQLYTVTFVNYYFGFTEHPAAHYNNHISRQREFNRNLQGFVYSFLKSLDNAALAALEAAKTQVLADDLGGRYSLVGNVVTAPLAEQEFVLGDVNPMFSGNDFMGQIDVCGNQSFKSMVNTVLKEKGTFNTSDKTYQYNDKQMFFTNGLANAANTRATFFAVQKDSLGMVQQFSPDVVLGSQTHNHIWDMEILPIAGIPIGLYYYDKAVDGSGLHGAASTHLTATKQCAFGFHTAVAFITPYNSDPVNNASSIMKVAVSST